jgi:hypothetical protein
MIVTRAITSQIERWKWGQVHEYRNGLMRPEITQYLVKITAELAEILGIALDEGIQALAVGHFPHLLVMMRVYPEQLLLPCLETRTSPIFLISFICLGFRVNYLTL